MASIKKMEGKKGTTYKITVTLKKTADGHNIVRTMTYKPESTKQKDIDEEVKAQAILFKRQVMGGELTANESNKITFADYVNRWKKLNEKNMAPRSYYDYLNIIRLWATPLMYMKINNIKASHVQAIITDMQKQGKSAGTIRKVHAVISSIMNEAYKDDIIAENVCHRNRLPKLSGNTHEGTSLSERQAAILDQVINSPYKINYATYSCSTKDGRFFTVSNRSEMKETSLQIRCFLMLALHSAARRGELLALTWNDIDFNNQIIWISKSMTEYKKNGKKMKHTKTPKTDKSKRKIDIENPEIFDMLRAWKEDARQLFENSGTAWKGTRESFDDNFVFIQTKNLGLSMGTSTPYNALKKIIERYNESVQNEEDKLPVIRLHDLRHTNLDISAKHSEVSEVSRRAGHGSIRTTQCFYLHQSNYKDKEVSRNFEDAIASNKINVKIG